MDFRSLVNENRDYLIRKGYLKEADDDSEEKAENSGVSDDELAEIFGDNSGSDDEKKSTNDSNPDAAGDPEGAPGSGSPSPMGADPMLDPAGAGMGGGVGSPMGDNPGTDNAGGNNTAEPTSDQPPQPGQEAAVDLAIPQPPASVLNVESKIKRLDKVLDKFFSNIGNPEINKEENIDEISNNIASLVNVDKENKQKIKDYMNNKDSGLSIIQKLKKIQNGIDVDQSNSNVLRTKISESINIIRNNYLWG